MGAKDWLVMGQRDPSRKKSLRCIHQLNADQLFLIVASDNKSTSHGDQGSDEQFLEESSFLQDF